MSAINWDNVKTTSELARNGRTPNPRGNAAHAARVVAVDRFGWPGGYLLALVTTDGGVLCPDCVRSEYASIYDSHVTRTNDGWRPAGILCAAETDSMGICDHCGRNMDEL